MPRSAALGDLLVVAFLAGSPAVMVGAQPPVPVPTGGIEGVVYAQGGSSLAGAEIAVRDARALVVARDTSENDGRFRIVGLPDGNYHVVVSLPYFVTKDVAVVVAGGRVTDVSVELAVATETINIVAASEVLTTGDALAPDATMASRELDQFVPGTGFQSAVRMFASVMATPTGVNIKGGRPNQTGVQLGAGTLVDPSSAIAHVPLPDDAIESVTVLPNPYSVEYGRFSSGLVLIQTRRAGDSWRFQINRVTPIVRNARGKFLSFRLDDFRPRYATGGPLIKDRLFLEQTGQVRYSSHDVPSRPENELRVSKSLSSFTRFDANLSARHSLVATVGLFPSATSSANLGTFTPPDATVDLQTFAKQVAVTERTRWSGETQSETTVHVLQSRTDAVPRGAAPMELRPDTTLGNFFNRQHRNSTALQMVEVVTVPRDGLWGSHVFKLGVDVLAAEYHGTSDSRLVLIERTNGTLARRLDYAGASRQSVRNMDVALFAEDRLQPNARWNIEFGGRIDRDGMVDRVNLTPRVGSALQLTASGSTVLRGGFGVFHGRTPSVVGAFGSYTGYVDTRYGVDGVTPIALPVRTAFVATPNLEAARSYTWDLGVDYRLNAAWSFHANVIGRDGRREFIVAPAMTATGGELQLSSDGRSSYRDVEVGVHFTQGSRVDVEALYDWSAARGDLNELTTFFDTLMAPVVGANAYAPLGADVPERLFVRGRMLVTPRWLVLGVADWRTGVPFSKVNDMLDFVGPRNDRRFPDYARLELGVEHRVTLSRWKPWVGVRVANVFGAFLPSDVQANTSSPLFGRFYNSEDRHFRLALRFGN